MTTEQNLEPVETKARYFIDLSWYQKQERSFAMLAATRLCPTSRKKEKSKSSSPPPKMTKLEQLNVQLKEAVEKENYEKAAQLRDEIRKLELRD